jgi:hypothetical protein
MKMRFCIVKSVIHEKGKTDFILYRILDLTEIPPILGLRQIFWGKALGENA